VFVELAAAEQHPVDVDELPVRLDECRIESERGQERLFRQAEAVPPQLDLPGQPARLRGGRVAVRDLGQIGERLVGAAERLCHLGFQDVVARSEVAELRQRGRGLLVPPGPEVGFGLLPNPLRVRTTLGPGPPRPERACAYDHGGECPTPRSRTSLCLVRLGHGPDHPHLIGHYRSDRGRPRLFPVAAR
jgi:hypothetical protein